MSTAPAEVTKSMVEIPLDVIEPSPYNRKQFNQKALEELAASIVVTKGVVEPVILRPVGKNSAAFQLVAGERRWLASKFAVAKLGFGRKTITSVIKDLTDAEAIELTLIENAQREDVHVLELCRTYKALMAQINSATGKPYTREDIADRVKKSYSLVCNILQAEQLIPEIQKACDQGKIGSSLALEICKYQPKDQEQIFLECFPGDYGDREYDSISEVARDKEAESTMSVRRLREWIGEHIHIDLSKAPFDTKDKLLLKGVGSCVECLKRTGSNPGLFVETQEVKKGDTCTDRGCYEAKKEALIQIRIAEDARKNAPAPSPAKHEQPATPIKALGAGFSQSAAKRQETAAPAAPVVTVQKISAQEDYMVDEPKPDVLYAGQYRLAKPGCKAERKAIYVDGAKIGTFAFICDVKNCSNHPGEHHHSSSGSRAPISFERRMEIWRQKVQFVYRDEVIKTVLGRLPASLGSFETALVIRQIVRTLPHRDGDKIRRIYGLAETASVENFSKGLKGAEAFRFLVICSLLEDLGIDGLAYGGTNQTFKNAAAEYKVDTEKLLESAKAALEKKRPKTEAEKEAIAKAKGDKQPVAKPATKPAKKKAAKTAKKKK